MWEKQRQGLLHSRFGYSEYYLKNLPLTWTFLKKYLLNETFPQSTSFSPLDIPKCLQSHHLFVAKPVPWDPLFFYIYTNHLNLLTLQLITICSRVFLIVLSHQHWRIYLTFPPGRRLPVHIWQNSGRRTFA